MIESPLIKTLPIFFSFEFIKISEASSKTKFINSSNPISFPLIFFFLLNKLIII